MVVLGAPAAGQAQLFSLWLALKVHGFMYFWCPSLWKGGGEEQGESVVWAWSFLRSPSDACSSLFRCPFPALSQSFRDLDSLFFGSFSFPFPSGLVFTI